jgi:hypothetical protein
LARSAAHPAGADAITELTQELHEVESAVALLLGAVAADSSAGAGDSSAGAGDSSAGAGNSSIAESTTDAGDQTTRPADVTAEALGCADRPVAVEPSSSPDRASTHDVARLVPRQRPSGEWTTTGVLPTAGGGRP